MKQKVRFKEYLPDYSNPATNEVEKGGCLDSFSITIEGGTLQEILTIAFQKAEKWSEELGSNVIVDEIEIPI